MLLTIIYFFHIKTFQLPSAQRKSQAIKLVKLLIRIVFRKKLLERFTNQGNHLLQQRKAFNASTSRGIEFISWTRYILSEVFYVKTICNIVMSRLHSLENHSGSFFIAINRLYALLHWQLLSITVKNLILNRRSMSFFTAPNRPNILLSNKKIAIICF